MNGFTLTRRSAAAMAALVLLGGALGWARDRGEAELHARQSALEREAEGLRATVAKLERGEPILPEDAVVVSASESVIKELLEAQLPFEADAGNFQVRLTQGEAAFRGSPAIHCWRCGAMATVGMGCPARCLSRSTIRESWGASAGLTIRAW